MIQVTWQVYLVNGVNFLCGFWDVKLGADTDADNPESDILSVPGCWKKSQSLTDCK